MHTQVRRTHKNLDALLSPARIAIVGVSANDPKSWGHRVVRVLLDGGFTGETVVVHPKTDFPNVKTVRSLAQLDAPELVVICVPAQRSIGVVAEAREAGAKAVIVFASEFAEKGPAGEALQAELVAAAGDMLMLGPNCFGISNRVDNVKLSAAPFLNNPLRDAGEVALIAQSGALGLVLSRCVEDAGSGYSHFISVGNEATLGATEIASHVIERDEVGVVLLYLEALRDPANLARTAERARKLGKRVVLLNAGRSDAGKRAALSHTAAIAGNDMFLQSLCDDFGIVRIHDDDEVKPVLAALERGWSLPPHPRVCILSNSGGAGAVLADQIEAIGGRVQAITDATRAQVAAVGMIGAGDGNPIDVGGGWESVTHLFKPTLDVLAAAEEFDALVVYYAFGEMCADAVVDISRHCAACKKPVTFIWQVAPPEGISQVTTPGILATSMGEGVRMLAAQMKVTQSGTAGWAPLAASDLALPDTGKGQTSLAEYQSSAILAAQGLNFVPSEFAQADALTDLAARVAARGWSQVVVKGNAFDVLHRNRVGLVRVGVQMGELQEVLREMSAGLDAQSNDPARGLIVQPMLDFASEIGVGALIDPLFGPVVLIGPGGIGIEDADGARDGLLLNTDSTNWDNYAARVERRYALCAGTVRPVLDAFAHLLGSGRVSEIDVNPMVKTQAGGLVALDALIVVAP
jgi:acyl-CoA synthetase (NDP forming)